MVVIVAERMRDCLVRLGTLEAAIANGLGIHFMRGPCAGEKGLDCNGYPTITM